MSGEIQKEVYDAYRAARKTIEIRVNERLEGEDYGKGLEEWAYIAIIRAVDSDDYPEIFKYSKRNKEAEFRLKINYNQFESGSPETQRKLISASLLRALKMMPEIGVKDIDYNRLMKDISQVLAGV